MTTDVLAELAKVLAERKNAAPDASYVASLHQKGLDHILKKLGEECTETVIAAKNAEFTGKNADFIYETADLWFHSLVLLSHLGETPQAVLNELERRFNLSGLTEKANRDKRES